jgi:hypothetical protein
LHTTSDLHNPLGSNIGFVVNNALHHSAVIANIEECKVFTVLASASNPATHSDCVADVLSPQATAQLGTK